MLKIFGLFLLIFFCGISSAADFSTAQINALNHMRNPEERLTSVDEIFRNIFEHRFGPVSTDTLDYLVEMRTKSCQSSHVACLHTSLWNKGSCNGEEVGVKLWSSVLSNVRSAKEGKNLWPAIDKCSDGFTNNKLLVLIQFLKMAHTKSWMDLENATLTSVSQKLKNESSSETQNLFKFLSEQMLNPFGAAVISVSDLRLYAHMISEWGNAVPANHLLTVEFGRVLQNGPSLYSLIGQGQNYIDLFGRVSASQWNLQPQIYADVVNRNCWIFRSLGQAPRCLENLAAVQKLSFLKEHTAVDLRTSLELEAVEANIDLGQYDKAQLLLAAIETQGAIPKESQPWIQLAHAQIALASNKPSDADPWIQKFSKFFLADPFLGPKFFHVPHILEIARLIQNNSYSKAMEVANSTRAELLKVYSEAAVEPVVTMDIQRLLLAVLLKDHATFESTAKQLADAFKTAEFAPSQHVILATLQAEMSGHPPNMADVEKQMSGANFLYRQLVFVINQNAQAKSK